MNNVGRAFVLGNERNYLRFGKDGAHAGDGQLLLPGQADGRHLVHLQLQGAGHQLQKAAGSGGALVVHDEVGHVPLPVQADDLAVLAADVHDGPGLGYSRWAPGRGR